MSASSKRSWLQSLQNTLGIAPRPKQSAAIFHLPMEVLEDRVMLFGAAKHGITWQPSSIRRSTR